MGFPTVKSDPYRDRKPKVRRGPLWPESFWATLAEQARRDALRYDGISPRCVEMIAEFNRLLYGNP